VRRQDFEARVGNALEMADRESEVLAVVERAFHTTIPDSPAELLLADNSHAHMNRMAGSSPFGDGAMCSVESPNRCPAARRGETQLQATTDGLTGLLNRRAFEDVAHRRHRQEADVAVVMVDRTPGEDLAAALARADVALFQAEHDGRDRIVRHDRARVPVPEPRQTPEVPTDPVSSRP
jgi:hypothetical protein